MHLVLALCALQSFFVIILYLQLKYNPRSLTGAGLFDGEGTERCWSYLGRFSTITKEMRPENRTDLLTEALLHYGNKQTLKMGNGVNCILHTALLLRLIIVGKWDSFLFFEYL